MYLEMGPDEVLDSGDVVRSIAEAVLVVVHHLDGTVRDPVT